MKKADDFDINHYKWTADSIPGGMPIGYFEGYWNPLVVNEWSCCVRPFLSL